MKKEDLIAYKKFINSLSEDELIARNKYLKGLQNGTFYGPTTGYSSIDKQWLKYYSNKELELKVPNMSINDYMERETKEYDNKVAFEYFGVKITYKEFKAKRDKVMQSLIALGVKQGDIVSVCLPNIPEVAYVFYAINKLGATANMLDPRTNKSTLTLNVNDAKSKVLLTLDKATPLFTDSNIENIIPISAINTLPKFMQKIVKSKDKSLDVQLPNDNRIISYDDFMTMGKNIELPNESTYKKQNPAVIAYTGGTTGVPKGVIITNEAFNAMVVENSAMGYNSKLQDKLLNIAPPWTYYGLSNCLNAFLCLGIKDVLVPALGPNDLGKLVAKHKPNHVITVPSALIGLMNEEKLSKKDLKYLKTLIVGADKLDPTFEVEVNEYLTKHKSSTLVNKGYGMTEVCAATTFTKGENNTSGTVGIPYLFENVAIFDIEDNDLECQLGQRGEIAIQGPKNMLGYFGENEAATSNVLKNHADGTVWVHTGDIGHMDENGKLFIDGRLKRMFVRNGFKIFPGEIENQIMKNPGVQQAAVIGVEDLSLGFITKAYLVLKEDSIQNEETIINAVNEHLKESLYDYELPDEIEVIDKMPLTGMNKINHKALEERNKKVKSLTL